MTDVVLTLKIVLDNTHESLFLCLENGDLLLGSVALAVIRENETARGAWQSLCAAAIKEVEQQAVQG
jgi:hypothetical protein